LPSPQVTSPPVVGAGLTAEEAFQWLNPTNGEVTLSGVGNSCTQVPRTPKDKKKAPAKTVLTLKVADPDIPILKEAKAKYVKRI
jgi:hypothetical protein